MQKNLNIFIIFIILILIVTMFLYSFIFSGNVTKFINNDSSEKDIHIRLNINFPNGIKVAPGETIITNINVIKLGNLEVIDLTLESQVDGPNNITIDRGMETFAIGTQTNIIKTIYIPNNAPEGIYTLKITELSDTGKNSTSFARFNVIKETVIKNNILIFIGITIAITFFLILLFIILNYKKLK